MLHCKPVFNTQKITNEQQEQQQLQQQQQQIANSRYRKYFIVDDVQIVK